MKWVSCASSGIRTSSPPSSTGLSCAQLPARYSSYSFMFCSRSSASLPGATICLCEGSAASSLEWSVVSLSPLVMSCCLNSRHASGEGPERAGSSIRALLLRAARHRGGQYERLCAGAKACEAQSEASSQMRRISRAGGEEGGKEATGGNREGGVARRTRSLSSRSLRLLSSPLL
eukprot:scaffold267555_cov35-Tisochrysis_lutea.AAC.1